MAPVLTSCMIPRMHSNIAVDSPYGAMFKLGHVFPLVVFAHWLIALSLFLSLFSGYVALVSERSNRFAIRNDLTRCSDRRELQNRIRRLV